MTLAVEAANIADRHRRVIWLAPSRDEGSGGSVLIAEPVEIWAGIEASRPDDELTLLSVQGGRERVLILHKVNRGSADR